MSKRIFRVFLTVSRYVNLELKPEKWLLAKTSW